MSVLLTSIFTGLTVALGALFGVARLIRQAEERIREVAPKVRCRGTRVDKDKGVVIITLENHGSGLAKTIRYGFGKGEHPTAEVSELGAGKECQIETAVEPIRQLTVHKPNTLTTCLKYSDKYGLSYETVQPVKDVNLAPETSRGLMRFEIQTHDSCITDKVPEPGWFKRLWIGLFG